MASGPEGGKKPFDTTPDLARRVLGAVHRMLEHLERCAHAGERSAAALERQLGPAVSLSGRAELRLRVSRGAILPAHIAAGLLPMKDVDAARWLRQRGLVHSLEGRRVVVWGDVADSIAGRRPGELPSANLPPPLRRAVLD